MKNPIKKTNKDLRQIPTDSVHLRFEEQDLDAYYKKITENRYILKMFKGNTKKPFVYSAYSTINLIEKVIEQNIEQINKNLAWKTKQKEIKAQRKKELISKLVPGTIVRTSFSYNMTFNYFFKIISKKGNTYKVEVLEKEWVDGDYGYTGSVKAGNGTGEFIQARLTTNGLKINTEYASIVSYEDSFYENHMD